MKLKRIYPLFLAFVMLFAVTACSKGEQFDDEDDGYEKQFDYVINDGKPVTLILDLNNLLPTANTVATPQQPIVFRSIQNIANNFMIEFPNVTIKWSYSKRSVGDWAQWMTMQVQTNDVPDIVMMHGAKYADRGWFLPLDDALDGPNPFTAEGERGSEHWKDMFPSYMWNSDMTTGADGNILAVPVTAYPGTATAYFYNTEIFDKLNLQIPETWADLMDICAVIKAAGYTAIAPWSLNSKANVEVWDVQFSLGPSYAYDLRSEWDYDNTGVMSQLNKLRATYEGMYYAQGRNGDRAIDLYNQVKHKYNNVLDVGADKTDYEKLWVQGRVAMMEGGMWRISGEEANTERKFEYGIFPNPSADKRTSPYCSDFEILDGAYNPPVAESFNICKQAIEKKGQGNFEAAVMFLQWLTLPSNLNRCIIEKQGEYVGAVYGTVIPDKIVPFIEGKFARVPDCSWTTGVTVATQDTMSRELQYYVQNRKTKEAFAQAYDAALYKGVQDMLAALKINPAAEGWINGYAW